MKKRLIFCDNSLFGLLNFRIDVILHLRDLGYEIFLLAPNENDFGSLKIPSGVNYIDTKLKRGSMDFFNDLKFFLFILKKYTQINPDIIFHYTIKPNIYGTLAAKILSIKSVAVVAGLGYAYYNNSIINKSIFYLYFKVLKLSSKVITLNSMIEKVLIKNGIKKNKILLFKYGEGINTEKFKS